MKKLIAAVTVICALVLTVSFVCLTTDNNQTYNEYLRIHVRANSNSDDDQAVKYEVKDEVVAFITPYVAECVTKERAVDVIGGILGDIERVCDAALSARGKSYKSKASIRREKFPTRVYGELTLEEGVYDALIIELGTGTGDNWWCVIYPPLCFTSADTSVRYRSVILDIIDKYFCSDAKK